MDSKQQSDTPWRDKVLGTVRKEEAAKREEDILL